MRGAISERAGESISQGKHNNGSLGEMSSSRDFARYLIPTRIIDSDAPIIVDYDKRTAGEGNSPVEQAVKLYLAVRDTM
jgi:hypothetical protein